MRPSALAVFEVDHQHEFGRALHWKVGGLFAPKDAIHIAGGLPAWIDRVRSVGNEATVSDEETERIDCRPCPPKAKVTRSNRVGRAINATT